jgi:crotonobetainyl-CoA:carnitine CoA-transferase CaiB-like acyl-CoA transferase
VLATKPTAHWLEFCAEHGIPAAPAAGIDEIIAALPEAEHPDGGAFKVIPPPTRFSATPLRIRRSAPLPGQHTHEVLTEAGFSDAEIESLFDAGIVRSPS